MLINKYIYIYILSTYLYGGDVIKVWATVGKHCKALIYKFKRIRVYLYLFCSGVVFFNPKGIVCCEYYFFGTRRNEISVKSPSLLLRGKGEKQTKKGESPTQKIN